MKKNLTTMLMAFGLCSAINAQNLVTGPSTTTTPYMWPIAPGSSVTSILKAGDVIGNYTLSGLGDGMGVWDGGGSTFNLVINHEIGGAAGAVRAHGQPGAFISKWVINKSNLQVVSGSDLIQNLMIWTGSTYTLYNAMNTSTLAIISRLCAGDLPTPNALYNPNTGRGTQEKIFMSGEEAGSEGRAFAHILTGIQSGTSYQLPHLGRYSWENAVASNYPQDKTIVVGLDDSSPGQIYIYVGQKSATGTTIEKAGLFGGKLYGIAVVGMFNETSAGVPPPNTAFNLVELAGAASISGATLNANSNNLGITNFLRPEDGAWDPNRPTDFYFVTTNSFTSPSRMWRLRFNDITNPELGGKIEAVLDGTEGQKMMDNLVMDNHGHIIIQEDPGGVNHTAKIWQYKISNDALSLVLDQDSTRFKTGGVNFLTFDEESSGVIDMQGILNPGWFLAYDQAHYPLPSPVVEGGQLLAFFNPATAAANPEVNIRGNNVSIADESTVTSVSNGSDFGLINLGSSITKTFEIQNTNSGTLIVNSMWTSGANAGDFVISGPSVPFTVAPNGSKLITVTFMPPFAAVRNAIINIGSSDFDEAGYNFAIKGEGAVPEINVQGNGVNIVNGNTLTSISDNTKFGMVLLGNSVTKSFVIQNTGNGTLTLNQGSIAGPNSNEFTWVSPPSFPLTLPGNGSHTFTVRFMPLAVGNRNAMLVFNSDDNDENTYMFNIEGEGNIDVGIRQLVQNNNHVTVYPNPASESVKLEFTLENDASASVTMFDLQGKLVYTLPFSQYEAGTNSVLISSTSLPNGTYFVKINVNDEVDTVKLIIKH